MSDLPTYLAPEAAGCQCEDYCSCLAWHHQPWCQHFVGETCEALTARQVGYHSEEAEDETEGWYPEDDLSAYIW